MTTPKQRLANLHEDDVAKDYGGQVTPMSGAGWVSKADVQTSFELIECKATMAVSYSVKRDLMDELVREALLAGKRPVLDIRIAAPDKWRRDYVVLTRQDYLELSAKAGERGPDNPRWGDPDYCPGKDAKHDWPHRGGCR